MSRKAYPSDVSDDEWAFAGRYLTLMAEGAPQQEHPRLAIGLMNIEFSSEIWYWHGPAPWYFVTVPAEQCHDLKAMSRFGDLRLGNDPGNGSDWQNRVEYFLVSQRWPLCRAPQGECPKSRES